MGLIGFGHWGPGLARAFDSLAHVDLKAICDFSEVRQGLARQRYPEVMISAYPGEVIESPEIDAVVISTPTSSHFELAQAALNAKKHVFVEKPLATTAERCETLTRLAEAQGCCLFVGHIFVYNAGIQEVKRRLDEGELGKIHYVRMTRTNLGPIRNDVSVLWDLAPHDLSILNFWFNEMPATVSAVGGKYLNAEREDVVFATYRFPSGVLANVQVSWLDPKKVREVLIVGEKKMLMWNDLELSEPVRVYDKKVVVDSSALADTYLGFRASIFEGDTLIPKIKLNEPLVAECQRFIESISDRSRSLSSGRMGTEVVRALEATELSLQNHGREVSCSS